MVLHLPQAMQAYAGIRYRPYLILFEIYVQYGTHSPPACSTIYTGILHFLATIILVDGRPCHMLPKSYGNWPTVHLTYGGNSTGTSTPYEDPGPPYVGLRWYFHIYNIGHPYRVLAL